VVTGCELAGLADEDIDLEAAAITVNITLLQVGGKVIWGKPKSRATARRGPGQW